MQGRKLAGMLLATCHLPVCSLHAVLRFASHLALFHAESVLYLLPSRLAHQTDTVKQVCKMQRLHFVFFGDSLTERGFERAGWGAGMTDLYRRKVPLAVRLAACQYEDSMKTCTQDCLLSLVRFSVCS